MSKDKQEKIKKEENLSEKSLKTNNEFFNYCNLLMSEIKKNSEDINNLQNQNSFLQNKLAENQVLLEMLMLKTGLDKNSLDDIKKIFKDKQNLKSELKEKIISEEISIFHDDITFKCKNCGSVRLNTEKSCKECGAPK